MLPFAILTSQSGVQPRMDLQSIQNRNIILGHTVAYRVSVHRWAQPPIDESLTVCLDIMLPFAIFTLQS